VADAADVAYAAELFSELVKGICARHPRAIFLRTEPRFSLGDESTKWGRASLNVSPHQTLALDLTKTLDQLLAQMHSKTRYNVHLAEKHGVEVAVEDSVSDAAGELLLETSRRAGIRAHATGYYKNLVEKLRGTAITAKVYCAYHGGELLAANVVLRYGDTSVYLFGGSSAHQRNVMAPYILQWRAIADAQAAGATAYDFWGVETDPTHPWAGFSRFKLGFGGEIETFAGTRDYVFSPAWYNAYRSLRNLARKIRK
jgi:lipid II:glycine glycyltransferase (peptidoglycan interpeptide bridge formation enzyme)